MDEGSRRYRRFLKAIEACELDGFLTSHRANIRYLFRFDASIAFAVTRDGETTLLVDSRYYEAASQEAVNCRIELLDGATEASLAEFLTRGPANTRCRLGFEGDHLTFSAASALESALSRATLIPTSGLVEALRQVKSPDELEKIRQAFQVAALGYRETRSRFDWQGTEVEWAARLEYELRKAGAEGAAFETIVAAGVRSSRPHARPTRSRIEDSGLLLLDFGAVLDGYHSDTTRVWLPPGSDPPAVLSIVQEAQSRAIAGIRPGVCAGEVDALARDFITENGHGEHFGHSLGHGLGLEIHEGPRINRDSSVELEEGMVFTVEPGIYLPGQYGVRWEDAVIVTDSGCEVLSIDPSATRSGEAGIPHKKID